MFSYGDFDIGTFNGVHHEICTLVNTPIFCRTRRIPLAYEEAVGKQIEEMLKHNIIKESDSAWNSPLVVIPKKDSTKIRICLDYRRLNACTERPVFHIPSSQELFDCLGGNSYFSTLDLSKGYYQIPMHPEDACKTAFSTPKGHYEFIQMPFGLNGAPATFQKALSYVLREEVGKFCCVYLDDVIVFGRTIEEHNERLFIVFSKLQSAGIKLSKEKCHLAQTSVLYLGHIIDKDGIRTDPKKVDKIKNWSRPLYGKDLHSFLGFAGYYRKFIKNFAQLAHPLETLLVRKGHKTQNDLLFWNKEAENAFDRLKYELCSSPVLAFPIKSGTYILDTDASHNCIGGVLSQKFPNGDEKVLYYASNRLTETECGYCTTRKELLAIVRYLRLFRHYLLGRKFVIRTDHKSLSWLMQ